MEYVKYFEITREIGIDMGHRVPTHGSKCRNLHGHRYHLELTARGTLQTGTGVEAGMVTDFSFLKELLMNMVDARCDHTLCLWRHDPVLEKLAYQDWSGLYKRLFDTSEADPDYWLTGPVTVEVMDADIEANGYVRLLGHEDVAIYVVPFIPTAEELARHWYGQLAKVLDERKSELAPLLDSVHLSKLVVWETPNCRAQYPVAAG